MFLGAGASVPYGKMTTKTFKDTLLEEVEPEGVWHAVLSSPAHKDVEDIFTVMEDLVTLARSGGGRFYIEHNMQLKNEVRDIYSAYHFLVSGLYDAYTWNYDYDDTLQYTLGPLVAVLEGLGKTVNIFTTNYDRSVERYCDIVDPQIELVDGFYPLGGKYVWGGWSEPPGGPFDDKDQQAGGRRVRLHKLHGSLTWRNNHATGEIVKNESEEQSRDRNFGNLLIYPSKSPKIAGGEPYGSTFEAFSNTMAFSNACIVVGFSFRDVYIRDKFKEFLDAGRMLVVVDPYGLNRIKTSMGDYLDITVVDQPDGPVDNLLSSNDGNGHGRIVVIQESLNAETSQKIANRALEYIQHWHAGAGP